ncbi:hypothetical protein MIND_01066400 [Mycena indigotica]|uniref:RSC complex protein n=1 Tax=Mycena indigotica TaxID=2126181 RepID=A0A8H6S9F7_9AGAR|nr:uncharacterized protein MIND_01066400 [Mycena indigotica]KAF7295273.1 hypothetical protein MIND_01066400 [Mycena indigotica]
MLSPAQKKDIEEVLDAISNATGARKRRLAAMFLDLVDRNALPHYYTVIPQPRALAPIRLNLENNKYKNPLDAYTDISLVFWNAMYYNESKSQIAVDAGTLKDLLENEWKARDLPTPPTSPPPQSAQKILGAPPVEEPEPERQPTPEPPQILAPKPTTPAIAQAPPPVIAQPNPIVTTLVVVEPDSETENEEETPDPPSGAPSDLDIARHLERGLPRFTIEFGVEGGWMEDVKHERHLEIVHALKVYKDAAGVKLSTSLEPQIPEEKLGITFKLLDSRSRSKTFYTSSQQFDTDLARLFESGRRYYLERSNSVAGIIGEDWAKVVALQRVANELTSRKCPALPLSEPLSYRPPLEHPGKDIIDRVTYKGFTIQAGDFVHLISGTDAGDSQMGFGRGRPLVCHVTGCWRDNNGDDGISVQWYLRADEIAHLMPTRRKRGEIFEGEVVQTEKTSHHHLVDVIEPICCQHSSTASRGRPRAPKWYPGWPLYVCGYRYDAAAGRVRHIRRQQWFSASGGGGEENEVLDLFERKLKLAPRPATSLPTDRSLVSAAGAALSGTEKLPLETVQNFQRDPMTGELLWFPGPPLELARPPGPRHSLLYLDFLANKYNPKTTNLDRNGVISEDEAMEPSPKRQRTETYLSASELIRQAFANENS